MLQKTTLSPTTAIATTPPADEFYDRLQRIWDQLLRLEDLGLIHTEFDKFRYAYQLAEAEIQTICLENAALRRRQAVTLRLAKSQRVSQLHPSPVHYERLSKMSMSRFQWTALCTLSAKHGPAFPRVIRFGRAN